MMEETDGREVVARCKDLQNCSSKTMDELRPPHGGRYIVARALLWWAYNCSLAMFLYHYLHMGQNLTGDVFEEIDRIQKTNVNASSASRTPRMLRPGTRGQQVIGMTDGVMSPAGGIGYLPVRSHGHVRLWKFWLRPLSLINALIVSLGMSQRRRTQRAFKRPGGNMERAHSVYIDKLQ